MKKIEVVAAIIRRNGLYFATQRGYGEFEGMWEFPGGKIEPGEEPKEALVREIREELAVEVMIGDFFCVREFDYPDFHLTLHCYFCGLAEGDEPTLLEHKAGRWLPADALAGLAWLPADEEIIRKLSMHGNLHETFGGNPLS